MKYKIIALLCLFLAGCSAGRPHFPPTPGTELLWPDPTRPPKVQWLGEIRTAEDIGLDGGFLNKLHDMLFGRRKEQILRPYGLSSDGDRIVVVDPGLSALHLFNLAEGNYSLLERTEPPELLSPIGIASAEGNLFLTDSAAGRVYRLKKGSQILEALGPCRLKRPTGIAFNPRNRLLYIADTVAHQIVVLDLSGQEKFRFGSRGNRAGEFNFPTDLWIDGAGRLYVTDALNARVQVFTSEGASVMSVGERGVLPGQLSKPKGVATDRGGWIYICDALLDTVQVYDAQGHFLFSIGSRGQGPGEFWMPSGITLDENGLIYVSDVYNQRIQVFRRLYGD